MSFTLHPALRCPLDSLPIEREGNCLRCGNEHSFDIARQGYVNLLGAQDKRSRDPGDSKAMINARKSFLDAGHYQPIASRLYQLLEPLLEDCSLLIDAGCGEGYYLQQLTQAASDNNKSMPAIAAYDISKWALQAAARRLPATWLVASNRHIPLANQSADVLLSLFGFPEYAEFKRVLTQTGKLVMVSAGPKHLIELREIIYEDISASNSQRIEEAAAAGFSLCDSAELNYQIPTLDQDAISQLLTMTPHLFRASADGKRRAAGLSELAVTVDVVFEVLQVDS
jgi:23S rRNA (guanine745-N1)-methyltransferase